MNTISDQPGHVYLIHLDERVNPTHPARHYLGYAHDLASRIQQHQVGGSQAARLMQVVKERHITWRIARVWVGSRALERRLKNRHEAPRLCPICNPTVQPGIYDLTVDQINDQLIPF